MFCAVDRRRASIDGSASTRKGRVADRADGHAYAVQTLAVEVSLVTMMHSVVLPDGIYKLEIPDVPHNTNPDYLKYSLYAQTWFRIVYPGEYYFHFGRISKGCITVLPKVNPNDSWTKIYVTVHVVKV